MSSVAFPSLDVSLSVASLLPPNHCQHPPQPGQGRHTSARHLRTPTQVQVLQALWELTADAVDAPVINVGAVSNVEAPKATEVLCE